MNNQSNQPSNHTRNVTKTTQVVSFSPKSPHNT